MPVPCHQILQSPICEGQSIDLKQKKIRIALNVLATKRL